MSGMVLFKEDAKRIISENLKNGYAYEDACEFETKILDSEAEECVEFFKELCFDEWTPMSALERAFE